MNRTRLIAATLLTSTALLAACSKKTETPTASGDESPVTAEDAVADAGAVVDFAAIAAAAVANPARPDADRDDDERRKPAAALAFMEIAPGMSVFEIEAGGGWYTELYAHSVGETGSVVMQNPEGFRAFVGEQIDARLANNRLSNVRQSLSNFDALDAPDASIDLVTWVQGPHELYYKPNDGAALGDPTKSYAEIYRILKPGGSFVVIDHSAVNGAPESVGDQLHRVDKVIVLRMADEAGFRLVAESDFLSNPADTRELTVFDPAIRGQTDQFALRFMKK